MRKLFSILTILLLSSISIHAQEPGMPPSGEMPEIKDNKPYWDPYWSGTGKTKNDIPEGAIMIMASAKGYKGNDDMGPIPGLQIYVDVEGTNITFNGVTGEDGKVYFICPRPKMGAKIGANPIVGNYYWEQEVEERNLYEFYMNINLADHPLLKMP